MSDLCSAVRPGWWPATIRLAAGLLAAIAASGMIFLGGPAHADRLENSVAVFSALDKVTARISKIEVPLNQTTTFGSLKVTPRVCYSRPATEQPKTTSFVEVDEVQLDGDEKRIFTGWMFAESPGLNAVEHPVFDVWLSGCATPTTQAAATDGRDARASNRNSDPQPVRRRRVRR
ncbi:MAG TPA: DUF2155 domain-containing protein [Hyphomicrobiaceae bacterium]|nr:DUF2155 domain-containing protein [Hyphomicrobiaceae bacterium]